MYQGLSLVQDLKLGHYIKIPPRAMFTAQLFSTVLGAVISTITACAFVESFGTTSVPKSVNYPTGIEYNVNNLGTQWNLSGYDTFMSAGVIWGAIGPARFFGPGSPYFKSLLGFAVGLVLPVIPWLLHKCQPDSIWHLINVPLIIGMPIGIDNSNSTYITPLLVAIIVNFYIKKYRHTWWKKYAYVMSSAFDNGSALAALVVLFIAKFNATYTLPFPIWLLNPADTERCVPDSVLNCVGHQSMGNGFGGTYNQSLDSSFCQKIAQGNYGAISH